MKALTIPRWGGPEVLALVDAPEPTPARGQVVVEVHALALNPKDVLVRKGKFAFLPGVRPPLVPCHDMAGVVVACGPRSDLAVGAEVYGWFESFTGGAGAERVAMDAAWLALKPASLSMADAASVPLAAQTALQALQDHLRVRRGERVVVNGASGGVGVFAVQIARRLGAHVLAVCSAANADLVRQLGADEHVDYAQVDVSSLRGVDAFFDVFGSMPWAKAAPTLSPRGRYCTTIPRPDTVARDLLARVGLHRAHLVVVRSRRRQLDLLSRWMEEGSVRPVVSQVLDWSEIADGHRQLETKHTRGKIVLTTPAGAVG